MVDDKGARLVAFGRMAGVAGMYPCPHLVGYLCTRDIRNDKYFTWTWPASIVTWLPHPVYGELDDGVLMGLTFRSYIVISQVFK